MKELTLLNEDPIANEEIHGYIEESGFFSDLKSDEINNLLKWVKVYSAPSGATILKEGEEDTCLCIIVHGQVSIFKETKPDKQMKVAQIDAGEVIGEMGLVDGNPFSASAIVSEDATVLIISRPDFINLVNENENLGIKLLWQIAEIISGRLRRTTRRLADYMEAAKK